MSDMDRALDMAEQFAAKLGDLAQQYGPDVADLALAAARVDAASAIVPGIGFLVVAGVLWRLVVKHVAAVKTRRGDDFDFLDCNPAIVIFAGMFATASSIGAAACLLNAWAWAGLFHPELWLAKQVLGL